MPAGFRIARNGPPVPDALLQRFKAVPVACISDCMGRLSAGGARLRPIGASAMVGAAVTVKAAPGDNLMVHKALEMAEAGQIIVVDAGGDLTNAIIGERMVAVAVARGLGGIVINGAIRDADALRDGPLPVFAAGITHRGPYKNGPGEINYPIAIDGMVVRPGDIICGDADGLVCIPQADAEALCNAAEAKHRGETENDPVTQKRDWIDAALRRLGCEFPEE